MTLFITKKLSRRFATLIYGEIIVRNGPLSL